MRGGCGAAVCPPWHILSAALVDKGWAKRGRDCLVSVSFTDRLVTMVWFQCEDCGDNLKKPKLPGHFRVCSAFKLSCIDCGEVFGQHNVDSHNQCITEAEKYGPKGQGSKALNGSNTKPKSETKPKPEVDINVGLSERPPWFCSLCNTKATSKQALLLHADGKKHRGKARAFHAANQPPKDASDTKDNSGNEVPQTKDLAQSNGQNSINDGRAHREPEIESNGSIPNNKRKHEASENGSKDKNQSDISTELQNGETEAGKNLKKAKISAEKDDARIDKDSGKKINWKKLITSALKSNARHKLKVKKLGKIVMESLQESGKTDQDKSQVMEMLEQKIRSSSKFVVDGKYIRLANDN